MTTPITVLWPEFDALFPRTWSDAVDQFYENATLIPVDGAGHFAPLEYPAEMADAILAALA